MLLSSCTSVHNYGSGVTAFSHAYYQCGIFYSDNGGQCAKVFVAKTPAMLPIAGVALAL